MTRSRRERAQLVLAAAAVVAVALAPAVVAYLQLGYHADVRASGEYDAPLGNAERVLERAVHAAGTNATGVPWEERTGAVERTRSELAGPVERLEASRVEAGTAYAVAYNATAADRWAEANCPRGPGRQFGDCRAVDGVVVQERAGETTVLAVAFDVRVTTDRGRREATLVVRVGR
ncbi:hypothetical protein BRC94_04715 [Halobacteriales archaeon QS_5_70_17]|nr:MAG: hypothetical protein BRC94_04715 [Halobacteriales archaeon QS_5_70_17]